MAIPSQPTDTSIVTNAYKDFGVTTPSSGQIARAISDGLEWVKRDLADMGHTWKFMVKKTFIITQQGVSTYAVPTDYLKYISARVGYGTRTGTAQGGSTAVCTLASTETAGQSDIQGKTLVFTGGTGVAQGAQIASYNSTTKVVTFDVALGTGVNSTSTYLIVDRYDRADEQTLYDLRDQTIPSLQNEPNLFTHIPDDIEGRLIFNSTPDRVYAVEFRYFADILKEDVTSTRYATTFLRSAAGVLTAGVTAWLATDDTRLTYFEQKYLLKMRKFANRWLYGYDLSGMQMTTGEE